MLSPGEYKRSEQFCNCQLTLVVVKSKHLRIGSTYPGDVLCGRTPASTRYIRVSASRFPRSLLPSRQWMESVRSCGSVDRRGRRCSKDCTHWNRGRCKRHVLCYPQRCSAHCTRPEWSTSPSIEDTPRSCLKTAIHFNHSTILCREIEITVQFLLELRVV